MEIDDTESPKLFSMHRIPMRLRKVNKEAYEPEMVTIGPYHWGNHWEMEKLKRRYMHSFFDRNPDLPVKRYWYAVEEMAERARNCYTTPIHLSKYEFIDMLVLDGSFIIELITPGREILYERTIHGLERDLILLENQIPFFVLCKLFDLNQGPGKHELLMRRILQFCKSIFPGRKVYDPPTSREVEHILDLVHSNWCPPHHSTTATQASESNFFNRLVAQLRDAYTTCTQAFIPQPASVSAQPIHGYSAIEVTVIDMPNKIIEDGTESASMSVQPIHGNSAAKAHGPDQSYFIIPSAAQLRVANVKFKKREYAGDVTVFDVEFKKGVLLMPTLIVNDGTESMLRNLIAFEQNFPVCKPLRVTDYALLLDCLINSSKDVQILSQEGIIQNHLGSEQVVVDFVNRLTEKIGYFDDNFEYADIFYCLNKHHKKPWNRAMAVLRQDYFSSPWACLSIFGATLLLLLTIAQTYFAARG